MSFESLYTACTLCPRACGVNRFAEETGVCGMSAKLVCARAALHFWEEPCISGQTGSGTVFFNGCNLRCIYCQNYGISRGQGGKELSPGALCEVFLSLQAQGAANINLVTPTHFVPHLLYAIPRAREQGLTIPIVYNCGGYESVQTLAMLDGLIDVYLPDFKYIDPALALSCSGAQDYPSVAKKSLREMMRQVGAPLFDQDGMMKRGVIVRHLVLPGRAEDAVSLIRDLFDTYGNRLIFSVMNQYTPPSARALPPPLDRPLSEEEYGTVLRAMEQMGIVRAMVQQGGTVSESFIPQFDLTGL